MVRRFSPFQIRWREKLGRPECPYLVRYTFLFYNFSLRIHHWIRSDDRRFFHDHSTNFFSIVLWGKYTNVTPKGRHKVNAGSFWYARGHEIHYLDVPKGGAWTLLICSRPYRKWGFWVGDKLVRPLKYFHKFGIPDCDVQ
jgi:hypothetical protein